MHLTKKIVKKSLAIVVLILAFTLLVNPVGALANESAGLYNFQNTNSYTYGQFRDVSNSAWYTNNVATAYRLDLMLGASKSYFNTNGKVTVAEVVTMAARIHSIYNTGEENFTQGSPWYKTYTDYALANGIITKSYNYDRAASRAEFAFILSRALPNEALQVINNIPDGAIPDTNASYAYKLYRAGILSGNDKYGTFKPSSSISRCEAAAIVTRMADEDLRKNFTLSSLSTEKAYAAEVVRLVNIERTNHGLNPVTVSTNNTKAAQVRASEIQSKFSHTRPNGTSCFTALTAYGVNYNYAGENIAIGQRTPAQVVQEWMASPGHRANILKAAYTKIGVGVKENTSGNYAGYAWAQFFTN